MKPTLGRKPRTGEKKLRVQFRNGRTSLHAYTAGQLRWDHRDCDWDILAVEVAK